MRNTTPDGRDNLPPRLLRRILRACLPVEDREALTLELDEIFRSRTTSQGRPSASAWYLRQVFGFVVRVGIARLTDSTGSFDSARSDLRVAARSIRRSPAFTLAFVLTLAVGVGVLASVYTAARWVLLRPVPGVHEASRLVLLRLGGMNAPPHVSWDVSNPDFITLRERLPVGGALAATMPVDVDLRLDEGEARHVAGAMVTANYFRVLGAGLAAGRPFLAGEDAPGAAAPAAVLSFDLATRLAGSATAAVGRDVRINGVPVRVVGVTAPGFRGELLPGDNDIWLPLSALPIVDPTVEGDVASQRGYPLWHLMIARLPSAMGTDAGVQLVASTSNAVMEQVRREYQPNSYAAQILHFQAFAGAGLDPAVRATVRRTLGLLGGAAAFLLCLAGANLANLAFIRSSRRSKATAIRFALGAGRASLARGVLAEAALLATASSAVALGLAALWSLWFQDRQLSEHGGALAGMHVGVRVVAATMVVALLTSIVAYARPAFSARFRSLEQVMRAGNVAGPGGRRTQALMLALQVALSLVLLVAAGLLGRTVRNLRDVQLGFQPDRLLMFSLDAHLHGLDAPALTRLGLELERRLDAQPGIDAAGFISPSPLRSSYVTAALYASDAPDVQPIVGAGFYVTPGVLDVLGARVIAGEAHWRGDSGTAVISRQAWAKLAPGASPAAAIGQLVPTRARGRSPVRIAAVIEDMKLSDIVEEPPPLIFRPFAERIPWLSLSGLVAGTRRPAAQATAVARTVAAVAPDLPVFDVRTARAAVDLQFAERSAMALVAATLGAIGVLLAAVGIYGVLSHVVATRQRDIGIRAALGARPARILSEVMRGGMLPVAGGVLAGVGGSALVSRLLAAQLFGLGRFDGATYWGGVGVLVLAAAAACLVPAYRATHVAPAEVLRTE